MRALRSPLRGIWSLKRVFRHPFCCFSQQNFAPRRIRAPPRSEIITPKIVSLPMKPKDIDLASHQGRRRGRHGARGAVNRGRPADGRRRQCKQGRVRARPALQNGPFSTFVKQSCSMDQNRLENQPEMVHPARMTRHRAQWTRKQANSSPSKMPER